MTLDKIKAERQQELQARALTYSIHAEQRSDPFAYRRALSHMMSGVGIRRHAPEDRGQPFTMGPCYGHNSRA